MLNQIAAIHGTGVAAATTSYESIATAVGTNSSTTITFSSIPQTYKHLQIRTITNTNRVGGATGSGSIYFNSDTTGTNYYTHSLYGDGASVAAFAANDNYGVWWYGSTTVNVAAVIDILDYTNTNKYKTTRILTGFDNNGSGYIGLTSLLWKNTGAISTLTFNGQGQNWNTNTIIALYGIKG